MVCCFFGHKDANSEVKQRIRPVLDTLVAEGVDDFLVGHQGAFDRMVLHTLRELKQDNPYVSYHVVLAYLPGKKTDYDLYDPAETLYPEGLEFVHAFFEKSGQLDAADPPLAGCLYPDPHYWRGNRCNVFCSSETGNR